MSYTSLFPIFHAFPLNNDIASNSISLIFANNIANDPSRDSSLQDNTYPLPFSPDPDTIFLENSSKSYLDTNSSLHQLCSTITLPRNPWLSQPSRIIITR